MEQDTFKGKRMRLLIGTIRIGLFENTIWRNIFLGKDGPSHTVDFILFDKESVTLVECTRQFLSNRSISGEYEVGKLTNVKAVLESYGHNVNAILVCAEAYATNPDLFNKVIHNFDQVYFMFKEDLEEIESNLPIISKIDDVFICLRNSKIHASENEDC
jgi:hypothetical protein